MAILSKPKSTRQFIPSAVDNALVEDTKRKFLDRIGRHPDPTRPPNRALNRPWRVIRSTGLDCLRNVLTRLFYSHSSYIFAFRYAGVVRCVEGTGQGEGWAQTQFCWEKGERGWDKKKKKQKKKKRSRVPIYQNYIHVLVRRPARGGASTRSIVATQAHMKTNTHTQTAPSMIVAGLSSAEAPRCPKAWEKPQHIPIGLKPDTPMHLPACSVGGGTVLMAWPPVRSRNLHASHSSPCYLQFVVVGMGVHIQFLCHYMPNKQKRRCRLGWRYCAAVELKTPVPQLLQRTPMKPAEIGCEL
jgi:hypothetical protein